MMLGIKAVIAESYERIHRSNLIGMGVLPLQFIAESCESLGLTGEEVFSIDSGVTGLAPASSVQVTAEGVGGTKTFKALVRIDTAKELDYYTHGGILQFVVRRLLKS
jgi:aconitate hydratase